MKIIICGRGAALRVAITTLTAAATATQAFDEGRNWSAGSYRQARQRFSRQHADVVAL
jgi:hypothetical protein